MMTRVIDAKVIYDDRKGTLELIVNLPNGNEATLAKFSFLDTGHIKFYRAVEAAKRNKELTGYFGCY